MINLQHSVIIADYFISQHDCRMKRSTNGNTKKKQPAGKFCKHKITSNVSSNILFLTIQKPLGKFNPPTQTYLAKIHLKKYQIKIKSDVLRSK